MSVIIMAKRMHGTALQEACFEHGYKRAKVFTKTGGEIKKKLGNADLYILFTNTVSHKMASPP